MYKSPGATDPFMRRHWKAKHATKSVSNNERSLARRMEGLSAVNVVALLYWPDSGYGEAHDDLHRTTYIKTDKQGLQPL